MQTSRQWAPCDLCGNFGRIHRPDPFRVTEYVRGQARKQRPARPDEHAGETILAFGMIHAHADCEHPAAVVQVPEYV